MRVKGVLSAVIGGAALVVGIKWIAKHAFQRGLPTMDDLFEQRFAFPDISNKKVLLIGMGGGYDVIHAYALARMLYKASTKSTIVLGNFDCCNEDSMRSAGECSVVGSAEQGHFNTNLPASDLPKEMVADLRNSSFVWPQLWYFRSSNRTDEDLVAHEMAGHKFDLIIGCDGGGDSITGGVDHDGDPEAGTDRRVLRVFERTGIPFLHVVFGPCCDGESTAEEISEASRYLDSNGCYAGSFSLEPLLSTYRAVTKSLSPVRTSRIITTALIQLHGQRNTEARSTLVSVPRNRMPTVPLHWLGTGMVFQYNSGGVPPLKRRVGVGTQRCT